MNEVKTIQSLKRKRNQLCDIDEPSSLRRSSRIKAKQTTMNANIETFAVNSKASEQKKSNKIAKKTTITAKVNASNDTGDLKSKASGQKKQTTMNANIETFAVNSKASEQKKSNKIAKKTTITATVNASNDTGDSKSKTSGQKKITDSHRSPRIILNRINLEEYKMITLKEGKTNHSKKHLIECNNEIRNDDDVYTLESNDCLPRRSKRKRDTMIEKKTMTTDNQSEKKKEKRKGRAKLSLVERMNNESPLNEFFTNEIVFATIPGYCPWPAAIMDINEQTIFVKFFGTGQINPVRSAAISRFDITKAIPLLSRKGYTKAIRELEMVLMIPSNISLFQQ